MVVVVDSVFDVVVDVVGFLFFFWGGGGGLVGCCLGE